MPLPLTDWLDWTVAEYEVGAPATSLSFERWFRNPVAMAQGAVGAPRVQGVALGGITLGVANTLTTTNFIDCASVGTVLGSVAIAGAANGVSIRVAFSNNNGTTYGAWQSFGSHNKAASQFISGTIRFNIKTGDWQSSTVSNLGAVAIGGGTFSVPSGANAFSISLSSPTTGVIDLFCIGGIE